ncbi:MAG TPA: prepilin peptidase [Tissierellaceae bacterium]|nr:prepilin peptidase [Tissierellaceae bacterium]
MILQGVFFSFLLMAASYTDIKRREIPDIISVLIALIGLLDFNLSNILGIVISIPFLISAVLVENSIGGGDIKLTAAVGIVLGFRKGIYGLILGLSFLVLFYLLIVLKSKVMKKQVARNLPMPLAPFLGIGFMIIYFMT